MIIINIKYIVIIFLVFIISCYRNLKNTNCICNYSIHISNDITIDEKELKNALSSFLKQSETSLNYIEIVIFGYSSGKEEYFYSESTSENIIIKSLPGTLEVLLKIKRNNKLEKAVFIYSSGNTLKENIENLVQKIHEAVCE